MTRKAGVIGYPLTHSLSPIFQQAAFDYLKMDVCYESWETEVVHIKDRVELLRSEEYLGANVTIPYKETVLDLLDRLDERASMIGAVNTIVNKNGALVGHNTDAPGFIRALKKDGGLHPEGMDVVILGAGGSARAVGFALALENVRSITFVNRTIAHAERIAIALSKYVAFKKLAVHIDLLPRNSSELENAVRACNLLVNCTSFGTRFSPLEGKSPVEKNMISDKAFVFDLVYNPIETPLLEMAQKSGAKSLGGLSMLVYQGAEAFKLWTGIEAPESVMLAAVQKAMGY
jgi:shikimate dehydrogenase